MSESKTSENREWQKEEAHLRACRSLIASNVEEYGRQYEARRRETKALFDAVQSGNVELYDQGCFVQKEGLDVKYIRKIPY